jgi:hypothetical protein
VEAEGLKRADAVTTSGGLSFGDTRSEVFAADPEVCAHGGGDLAPAPETAPTVPTLTPTVTVVAHPLPDDGLALAKAFRPDDPTGEGMVQVRQALGLRKATVEGQKRSAA